MPIADARKRHHANFKKPLHRDLWPIIEKCISAPFNLITFVRRFLLELVCVRLDERRFFTPLEKNLWITECKPIPLGIARCERHRLLLRPDNVSNRRERDEELRNSLAKASEKKHGSRVSATHGARTAPFNASRPDLLEKFLIL
jgi:hypothetical protein